MFYWELFPAFRYNSSLRGSASLRRSIAGFSLQSGLWRKLFFSISETICIKSVFNIVFNLLVLFVQKDLWHSCLKRFFICFSFRIRSVTLSLSKSLLFPVLLRSFQDDKNAGNAFEKA